MMNNCVKACFTLILVSSYSLIGQCSNVKTELGSSDNEVFDETTDLRFLYQCVDQHNAYRDRHGLPGLHYNREVEVHSRQRAMKMALAGQLLPAESDTKSTYAENAAWTAGNVSINCRIVVDTWYADAFEQFDGTEKLSSNTVAKKTSEQEKDIAWKRATRLGCAQVIKLRPAGGVFTVCSYATPAGGGKVTGRVASKDRRTFVKAAKSDD